MTDTTFVDFGNDYEDVKEPELAPTNRYHLRIESCQYKEGEKPNYLFNIKITDGEYAALFHNVYLPTENDDVDKRKQKILFAKRFFALFNIPVIGGKFNPSDAVGREAVANVNLSSFTREDGSTGKNNKLVVPNLN